MEELYDGYRRRVSDKLENDFMGCPRYDKHELTDDQIEEIAERAAEKAIKKAKDDIYKDVGETVVGKFKWMVGAIVVGVFVWMVSHGLISVK
ncbi:MAG: hypothetical protein PHE88_11740 [Elusimicrobia bacterium]|nr:hypothetical protein [Elusimicrobiota bacterium]